MSFKFDFTADKLKTLLNGNSDSSEWFSAMSEILPKYDIVTPERVAGFIAQCAHESNNFKTLEENLNYSRQALLSVFGRYFGDPPKRNPDGYARNPEKIANYVYMDEFRSAKMGNIKEGDGWRFRGRGLKQLTGRDNYARFGKSVGMSAEEAAKYVSTKQGALESACWFWDTTDCNRFADAKDIEGMTQRINGGMIGLSDRKLRWEQALALFSTEVVYETVRLGSKGPTVRAVQEALGLNADGIFGPQTEKAVKAWQGKQGLVADGIVGPITIERMLK